uniref:Uncharacterized protein n=1 Tax=Chenopodium quinoa TaxID=63459 RepID=A0A803N2V3_CHEQI
MLNATSPTGVTCAFASLSVVSTGCFRAAKVKEVKNLFHSSGKKTGGNERSESKASSSGVLGQPLPLPSPSNSSAEDYSKSGGVLFSIEFFSTPSLSYGFLPLKIGEKEVNTLLRKLAVRESQPLLQQQNQQQQQMVPLQETCMQSRAESLQNVDSTIHELNNIFTPLATMWSAVSPAVSLGQAKEFSHCQSQMKHQTDELNRSAVEVTVTLVHESSDAPNKTEVVRPPALTLDERKSNRS